MLFFGIHVIVKIHFQSRSSTGKTSKSNCNGAVKIRARLTHQMILISLLQIYLHLVRRPISKQIAVQKCQIQRDRMGWCMNNTLLLKTFHVSFNAVCIV